MAAMAANTRYWPCPVCSRQTLQVRNSGYEVPHVAHMLAILTLSILTAPAAGLLWCVVWAIHAGGDFLQRQGQAWLCTECGRELPPPRAFPLTPPL